MIHAYQEVRPLGDAEFENFCIRLAYPEKFWKLANHYFNSRKTWNTGKKPSEAGNSRYAGKKTARICKVSALEVSF